VLPHTNDHHGHYIQDPKKKVLGMAARKTLIDQVRSESKKKGQFVLLASGGDINTGSPESDFFDAEPDFKAMSMMGYDAMALGNHEFDNPFKVLLQQKKWANFPFLAANIYLSKDQKEFKSSIHGKNDRPFLPYIVKTYGDKKVLIVGLTTEESAQFTKVKDVIFRPAIEEAKELLPRLNKEIKPDLTVVLSHLGYFIKGRHRGYPADYSLAKALGKKNIDIIVGGHTQKALATPHIVNGVAILQAGEWGKYLGKMVIDIQGRHEYKIKSYELLGVNYSAIPSDFARPEDVANIGKVKRINVKEDPKIAKYLRTFYQKYPQKLDESFAVLDSNFLGRGKGKGKETNLGRLISHSFCYMTNSDVCYF
jgi:5'-nucleotidase/UDP-sugar diphosphatase